MKKIGVKIPKELTEITGIPVLLAVGNTVYQLSSMGDSKPIVDLQRQSLNYGLNDLANRYMRAIRDAENRSVDVFKVFLDADTMAKYQMVASFQSPYLMVTMPFKYQVTHYIDRVITNAKDLPGLSQDIHIQFCLLFNNGWQIEMVMLVKWKDGKYIPFHHYHGSGGTCWGTFHMAGKIKSLTELLAFRDGGEHTLRNVGHTLTASEKVWEQSGMDVPNPSKFKLGRRHAIIGRKVKENLKEREVKVGRN